MQKLLHMALKQAEEAEIFYLTDEEMPVEFEANRLKHIQSRQSTTVALRIFRNGRTGYAVSSRADEPEQLVDMAVATAEFGMPARFAFPSNQAFPKLNTYDPAIEDVSIEEMVSLGRQMVEAVTQKNTEVLCDAGVSKHTGTVRIINSSGLDVECRSSLFSLGLGGNLIRGTDMLFVGDGSYSTGPASSAADVIQNIERQLDWASQQASITAGEMPVIFTPHGVESAMVSPLISAFNGKMVLEGASPLKNRLGEAVFSPSLNIYDDATTDWHPSGSPFDDEGIATRATPLVEEGTARNFYYDLHTAALAGTQSTGNGNRSGGSLPGPGINALKISPGDTSFEDMLSDIRQGLIVEHLMGGEQGNTLGGDFSGNVLLGYKIENGKIKGRVKNTMVYGNVYNLLRDLAAIGSDARWVGGSLFTPSIYCPKVAVASK